jgi:uroporphyrinogen-III synthase
MRLLVTRPEPDASLQAESLLARGHEPVLAPLLTIQVLADTPLQLAGAQALIVTSRNALRAVATRPELGEALKLPLYAVGEATARAATELGFHRIVTGPGTGEGLVALIRNELEPSGGALVHLAGDRLAFDLKSALEGQGFQVHQPALYTAAPTRDFPPQSLALLREGKLDGVILMSPRTAAIFAGLVIRHKAVTEALGLRCYCLSPAVAEALAPLRPLLRVAGRPREEDLLALIDSEAASSG